MRLELYRTVGSETRRVFVVLGVSCSAQAFRYNRGMKWLIGFILLVALALSGYAVYKAGKIEADTKPKTRPITAVAR